MGKNLLYIFLLTVSIHNLCASEKGSDWISLRSLLDRYPLSVLDDRPVQKSQDQKNKAHNNLNSIYHHIRLWISILDLKNQHSFIDPDGQEFFSNLRRSLVLKVLKASPPSKAIGNFHLLMDELGSPPLKIPFDQRFLSPEFALEYKRIKIKFYKDLKISIEKRLKELGVILKEKNLSFEERNDREDEKENLEKALENSRKSLKKWSERPIAAVHRQSKTFSYDESMGITFVQKQGFSGKRVPIGIIEPMAQGYKGTGIHQDFKAGILSGSDPIASSHGTHVLGIIGARPRTIHDRSGVAPEAEILFLLSPSPSTVIPYYDFPTPSTHVSREENKFSIPLITPRILLDSQFTTEIDQRFATIFQKAIKYKLKVINGSISMGWGPRTEIALRAYIEQGGVLIIAAGNGSISLEPKIFYEEGKVSAALEYQSMIMMGGIRRYLKDPIIAQGILYVGNLKDDHNLHPTSNLAGITGKRYIAAYGTQVPSTVGSNTKRTLMTGTSQAAPTVTGAIALLIEAFPACTPQQITGIILDTAQKIDTIEKTGRGRLNLKKAFMKAKNDCPGY
jgi:hypothetical protein